MALVSIQAIVLMPVYLGTIGARLFGAWLGTGELLVWLQACDLGLPNLIIQRIGSAHGRGDTKAIGAWFASAMAVLSMLAVLLAGCGAVAGVFVPGWMGLHGGEASTLRWCFTVSALAAAACVFHNGVVGFSRGIQDTAWMNAVLVCSAVVSFATAAAGIAAGLGLWAPALASVTRAATLLAGDAWFTMPYLKGSLRGQFRPRAEIVREIFSILPATAVGGVAYAAMNQSQVALAALLLRPEAAVVLAVTRKAADLLRALTDTIATAVYGSFASLAGAGENERTQRVLRQIRMLRTAVAIAGAVGFVAVNRHLVEWWVGRDQYGGTLLTVAIAIESVAVGASYLLNSLYRATGPVARGSWLLAAEGLVRVPLMIAGLHWMGLCGPPLAASATAAVSLLVVRAWLPRELLPRRNAADRRDMRLAGATQ